MAEKKGVVSSIMEEDINVTLEADPPKGFTTHLADLQAKTQNLSRMKEKGLINEKTGAALAIREELDKDSSNVYIGALCPGPVDTEFNKVAKVKFTVKSLSSEYVTKYAIDKMFKNKMIIIPGTTTRMAIYLSKLLPFSLKLPISYKLQESKDTK